ncbi:MAG: hypothetical protein KKD55_01575, partial [Candidatus Omnitrophica bacterium]|nr:hypothetical protein [Candidatus Omnitrophota bacterium]
MNSTKNMAKHIRRALLFSISITFLVSCSISPTYPRKEIEKVIKNMCEDEFNIDVNVWDVGDTVWIYAPLKIINEDGQWNITKDGRWNEDISKNTRIIHSSLNRIFLNIDKPPKFYCFVMSDIEKIGIDWYTIVFIPDIVRYTIESYTTGHVSTEKMNERTFSSPSENPQALGDKVGEHIQKYDITMGEFISYLVKQSMERKFTAPEVKDNFQVNDLRAYYLNGKLGIIFDIMIKEYKEGLPEPFEEAKKAVKKFLKIYDSSGDIVEIEIF